jgi:hypothetical protein
MIAHHYTTLARAIAIAREVWRELWMEEGIGVRHGN